MIREIAELRIRPEEEGSFLASVKEAVPVFQAAKGCLSMHLERTIETPGLFRLHVLWEAVEDHTVDFRGSPGFLRWRSLVGRFFVEPPKVDHSVVVVHGFQARE